jgi:hypothetical protein
MQQGHICMESSRNVERPTRGHRAHPQHEAWLQAGQAGPTVLQSGEASGHGQRVILAS